jgi:hypothetical protein
MHNMHAVEYYLQHPVCAGHSLVGLGQQVLADRQHTVAWCASLARCRHGTVPSLTALAADQAVPAAVVLTVLMQ